MKLRRLRAMRPAEILFRGRQEFSKHLERIGVIGNHGLQLDSLLAALAPGSGARAFEDNPNAAGGALLERFQEGVSECFFEGAMTLQTRSLLGDAMPAVYAAVIAAAEEICQGRFDLLGYQRLFFGDPVDWHLDPICGRRAPFVHWSRIDPLDPAVVGDSKVVWELNRHQWLLTLGQAYRITGEERYAHAFATYMHAWMQANPTGMGINWTSSLEVALRLISWCWALVLFRGSRALSAELFAKMLGAMQAHAAHIARHLSYYFSPNTHLTGEALGLFYVGVVFPELRVAAHWRALGTRILLEQMERQVPPDGVYFEQSTWYQNYTVEIYLHFLILAERNRVAVPPAVAQRVQRMLDFLLAMRRPDGSMPQIGDADGGALLPLTHRAPEDFRALFSTAAALFGRADYAWAAGGLAPETLWLLGMQGRKAFAALNPAPPAAAPSGLFPQGGYAVMRSAWDAQAHHLVFDVGPLGCRVSGGHGHADLLSIQCAAFGKPYLIDAGTYCYTADTRWRDHFRGTAAHSTVMVDGVSQATPAGPFAWRQRPQARLRRWISTASFDLADADHDAYSRLADPVTHRRRVLFAKGRYYWVVVDDLEGGAEHRLDLRFQFAPMEVTLGLDEWARARAADGRELRIRAFATTPLAAHVAVGEVGSMQGWVSPNYGRRHPAPMLRYTTVGLLPLRIVTLLLPVDCVLAAPQAASMVDGGISLVFEDDAQETIRIGEQDIVVDRV